MSPVAAEGAVSFSRWRLNSTLLRERNMLLNAILCSMISIVSARCWVSNYVTFFYFVTIIIIFCKTVVLVISIKDIAMLSAKCSFSCFSPYSRLSSGKHSEVRCCVVLCLEWQYIVSSMFWWCGRSRFTLLRTAFKKLRIQTSLVDYYR